MSRFFCLCDGVKLEKNCEHFSSLNEVDSLTHGISSARSRVGIVNRSTFFLLSWPPFSVFFVGMPSSSQYLRDLVATASSTTTTTTARGSSFASTSYDAREQPRGFGGGSGSGRTTTTTTPGGEFFHHHHPALFIPSAKENSATAASAAAATTAAAAAGKAGVSPAIKAISGSFGGIIEVR